MPAAGATTTKLTATGNNIAGNGYGVVNETAAGADQALPFTATGNWWGHVAGPSIGLPKTVGTRSTARRSPTRASGPRRSPRPPCRRDHRQRPTGQIDPPTATNVVAPGTTYTLRAVAADDFGVRSVEFAVDGVPLATDATAPYATTWTPPAALAGKTVTLSVTITDSAGQTTPLTLALTVKAPGADPDAPEPTPAPTSRATATPAPAAVKPAAPDKVTLTASAAKGRKLTLSGKLTLPQGIACPAAGKVSVTVTLGKKVVKRATAKLDATTCAYKLTATLPKGASGRKVTVKARFLTAGSLLARSAPSAGSP